MFLCDSDIFSLPRDGVVMESVHVTVHSPGPATQTTWRHDNNNNNTSATIYITTAAATTTTNNNNYNKKYNNNERVHAT